MNFPEPCYNIFKRSVLGWGVIILSNLFLTMHSLYAATKDTLLDKAYTSPNSQTHENFDILLTKRIFS